jgi:hypothetical protein
LLGVVPKGRCLTAAIHGHEDGLATLELDSSGFFFLINSRIFKDLGAVVSVDASPSGVLSLVEVAAVVPGGLSLSAADMDSIAF